ncbi:MAG: purine-nucleoside phosphorylase [Streptococcaceae bacterium]|jgi:purine-nucleoside phosphorylase|nr:purine-nucleoside phosphorylase [Streptococcaceae bacterium]
MTLIDKIKETAQFLQARGVGQVDFGLILGSGLGELADEITNAIQIDYADIPNWGRSTVVGHAGKLVYGTLAGKQVLALQGRFHFYEGNSLEVVTFPVRVMAELKATGLIVTNAAGGVTYGPGTLMLITDHLNFTGQNPLIGQNLETYGPRFPDMSHAYDPAYQAKAHAVAQAAGIALAEGVYMGFTGPTYETPAEIRFAETIGADAVGMSTVPEVIIAVHSGLRVLGFSAITNHATGKQAELNHAEVVKVTTQIKDNFKTLVKSTLAEL